MIIHIIFVVFLIFIDDQKSDKNEKQIPYGQDPCASEKIGFGYSASLKSKNSGSINFIKGETINLQNNQNSNKICDIKKGIVLLWLLMYILH